MTDLVLDAANSLANPRVVFAWQSPNVSDADGTALRSGFFQPLDSVSFRILRSDGTEYIAATVVDPEDPANQLDADDTEHAGRLIVLPFTIASPETSGVYTVEVTFVAHPEGSAALPEQTVSWTFRVLESAQGWLPDSYAQIQDMLDQGFPVGQPAPLGGYSFAQARRALLRASRYIEEITSRFFEPRYLTIDADGRGGPILQLQQPIVGLTSVGFTFTTFSPADLPVSEGDLRVYNRHVRQAMPHPDDRDDPRVEFLRVPSYTFPRGQILGESDLLSSAMHFVDSQQSVKLAGVWGYTDYDGSPFGKTPDLIVELCLRLAARYIGPLWSSIGAGPQTGLSGPVTAERTLDQSVSFANLSVSMGAGAYAGAFTGDPEIDQLLALYMAPPIFRSA